MLASVTASDGSQEGQGVVLQEAQATGVPVVATDHGPFPEGVVGGVLVPERDSEALAHALGDLIASPGRWPELGRRGRTLVERHYNADEMIKRLLRIYSSVAGRA